MGSAVTVNARPYTVVGVAPPAFTGLDFERLPDLYVSLPAFLEASRERGQMRNRDSAWLGVMGRVAPGVSFAQAGASAARVCATPRERAADRGTLTAGVEPMHGCFLPDAEHPSSRGQPPRSD